jgi:hypothetical protein
MGKIEIYRVCRYTFYWLPFTADVVWLRGSMMPMFVVEF